MKRYLTVGTIFGILVAIIVTISWLAFPAWHDPASGGFLTLLGATFVGVLAFIQGGVSIWKDLKEEKEKKEAAGNIEQHGETNVHSERVTADQIGGIRVTGNHVTIIQQEHEQPKLQQMQVQQPTLPEGWYTPHPYPMPPNFTGRVTEREMLTKWLNEDNENRLFIIRGLGGFGKSALTWHWLTHDIDQKEWTKLVWWSFYEGDASFEHFIEETLKYLKLDVPQGQRPQVDKLLKAMQSQKIILIMDGFERALRAYSSMNAAYQGDEEPRLEDNQLDCVNINAEIFLKSVCSLPNIRSKVLMTTRLTPRALKPRGEFMLGCREEELTAMQKADAVEFFHKQKIEGTHAEIETACTPYGYHPLSLRILAGLIANDRENPSDIKVAEKLDITNDITQNRNHVLKVSYDTLSLGQQKLLSNIACFRFPMSYQVLKVISSKPSWRRSKNKPRLSENLDDSLQILETRGLLHWDRKANKYDLHPIVRSYAYEQLTAHDRTTADTRLRNYFAAVDVAEQPEAIDDLAPIIELYHHTVRAGEFDSAIELFRDRMYSSLYYQLGAYETVIELLRPIFVDTEHMPPRLKREQDQGYILNVLASSYRLSGHPHDGIQTGKLVLDIAKKLGNKEDNGIAIENLSTNT